MNYQFIDESATIIKVIVGTDELLFKKVYCSTAIDGDYFILNTHEYESNKYRQEFKVLYSDSTNPSVASASALQTAVDAIINNYAGASSGGGILHAIASGTDTYTASITGVTSYADGDSYLIRFTNGNTTVSTLNINSLGAVSLYRNNDGQLIGGDIENGGEMLVVYNSGLNVFQCIGTSPNTIIAYVTNADSVSITKGMPVYAFGGTGDRMTVKRANNTSDSTSAQTVGLVMSTSIAAGQKGFIMLQGLLDGLNTLPTSTWADGDAVYLGATAGTITKTKPFAPNHLVYLGFVTTASPGSAGRMYVRVQNGYELDELHNVQAQSPTNKDTIYFDSASSQWKTASLATILGYTPVTNARTISTTAPLSGGGDLSADRTLSIVDAVADGATKGASTYTASDFNSASGVISIDYTNGQASSASAKGFLTSTDWSSFNNNLLGFGQFRKAGRWYPNSPFGVSNGAINVSANSIVYIPFWVDASFTLTGLGVNVTTIGSAGSTARLGIYTNNSSTTAPSTRLVDSGTFAFDVTGARSVTGLSVALTKGLYWLAFFTNATSGAITAIGNDRSFELRGQATIGGIGWARYSQILAYTSLPASAGTLTDNNATTNHCIYYTF